ncbi:hypothetical protein NLK61_05500 [Pseudomonas fuscovaginae UPB0736]|uniref:hypothetical protein n=1 Tax=Pseudomonas asplenii TaxID=53407 RepID=UPI0002891AB0|nr:hypothetical protein [Pseudomonas fuscovaginae]UUQ66102.1 hypothetical protein NLK61_05500 [Pseudomonas fuscovaginae UPB0736]
MNGISPVWPAVVPAPDEMDGPQWIDLGRHDLDEETIPEGVALLLAVFEPPSGLARPRDKQAYPQALMLVQAGKHLAPGDRAGVSAELNLAMSPEADALVSDGNPLTPAAKNLGWAGEGLSDGNRGAGGVPGPVVEVPVALAPGPDGPVTAGNQGDASAGPPPEGLQEPALRGIGELLHGVTLTRPEPQAPSMHTPPEGLADERAATSGQQEHPPSESAEQDDETNGNFLQLPFSNERAQGQVLISREGPGAGGLLIRATDRQVFEQLEEHFAQVRKPGWRLEGATLSTPGHDGVRLS